MFESRISPTDKITLSGFNNLTKVLSFNLYDFCIALNDQQKDEYINYINDKYGADKIAEISNEICRIIDAQILGVSKQDYDPVGASTMVLMSDIKGGKWNLQDSRFQSQFQPQSSSVSMHLDKSHITAHTYPDASDPFGICSFRVDIDVATCGEIVPLDAINYLFEAFECDVVYIDYVVRGYTRLANGKKIYNDHHFNSIQEFIKPEILANFKYKSDINMPHDNIWQTKLFISDFGPERYLMNPEDSNHPIVPEKMALLYEEMREVFYMIR